ncbi:MAG: winged helix-turn-helix transcriptional regulator, partial [Gammaproteobacteria bacterium]|nr:winged helix-turn-helix transcriptional regulator [Gammaproteobacteria bacterium]
MTTLYQKVAEDIAQDIQQGVYLAGQKVPSVRSLSKVKDVSISTITQAYALLEDQGFLTAKPQSGYYVKD